MRRITSFKTLDAFRGLAAVWVVMVHSCDRWLSDGHMNYLQTPLYAFAIRGQLGVVLFFVISGYCITAAAYGALVSGKSIWRYSFERVRRIYPPYLAALVMAVISIAAIGYADAHHLVPHVNHLQALPADPVFWTANLLLIQIELKTPMVDVVFWSLCYEIAFYFLIGIFLSAAQWVAARRSSIAGATVLVNAVGISTMLALVWLLVSGTAVFPFDLWHQFSIGGLLFVLMEFKPDTVKGYTQRFRWTVLANVAGVLVLTVLYAALRQVGMVDIGHPSSRVRSILCLLFAAALIGLRRIDDKLALSRIVQPLMWIGAFSYSLYLVHPIVLPYVDILSRRAGLNGSIYWIAFWIQVSLAVAFGFLFHVLIERRFISKRQVARQVAEHVV